MNRTCGLSEWLQMRKSTALESGVLEDTPVSAGGQGGDRAELGGKGLSHRAELQDRGRDPGALQEKAIDLHIHRSLLD